VLPTGQLAGRPVTDSVSRVLFISHDAGRTGAPILLLHLLRWLKQHGRLDFEVLLREGGELESQFHEVATVHTLGPWQRGVRHALARHRRRLLLNRLARTPGPVYSNTIVNADVIEPLTRAGHPLIVHVHELDWMIHRFGLDKFELLKHHAAHFIACAEAVKRNLVVNHGIAPSKIDVVHEFIDTAAVAPAAEGLDGKRRIKHALGIPEHALIVGSAGTTDWRKAPDLFLQMAGYVSRHAGLPPVHFVWVGGANPGSIERSELEHDVVRLGLADRVHFLGARSDAIDCFRAFDVFAMTSREDPYPLVCLEAAAVGVPIVCFQDAGGTPELLEAGGGLTFPYLDVWAMSQGVVRLLQRPEERHHHGTVASTTVRSRHDVAVGASQILEIIQRFR
jgi:glycosyltransferase involved in cell wall biosynthesis